MQPLWKTVWNFLIKLKELLFHTAIPKLQLYPMNPESPTEKDLGIPMFIAVLFTIAKGWKQPKGPSINQWIKKLVRLHNTTQKKERRNCYLL